MASFDNLLKQIHDNTLEGAIASDSNDKIQIDINRKFILPKDFNKTIAYEGDVNSQIVTFECSKIFEGHDLSKCGEKRLRWYNVKSRTEGNSVLSYETDENKIFFYWEAPPAAFVKSGELQISISCYDYLENGKIAYSWNTSVLKDLKVGESLTQVGPSIQKEEIDKYIPAVDEVLSISTDTREIVAPKNYNYTIGNYGDVGTSVVYFKTKRYIRGIDLLDANTQFRILWKLKEIQHIDSNLNNNTLIRVIDYNTELENRDSEGSATIIWTPSEILTANSMFYTGNVQIQIEILSGEKVWRTAPYNKLSLKESIFYTEMGELPVPDSSDVAYRYEIIGDPSPDTQLVENVQVGGVVQLRTFSQKKPILIRRNELAIEVDDNLKYIGIKVGETDYQSSSNAPYVAYSPELTIRIHGGDSTGTLNFGGTK